MSYTNTQLVRHHLVAAFPTRERIYDQPHMFENDNYTAFFGGATEEATIMVKSIHGYEPTRTSITLDNTSVALTPLPLIPGSVVVASDSSLGTIYKENIDYAVDYAGGTLIVKDGGNLSVGQTVIGWYQTFVLYTRGNDYQIEAGRGEIKRLVAGDIAFGEMLYLDYTPLDKAYNEEVLANAVNEANGLVERSVDPESQFGADPALQAAATCRALEIICRTSATRELSGRRGQERSALVWIQLAETYAKRSDKLLSDFHPPFEGPTPPVHS